MYGHLHTELTLTQWTLHGARPSREAQRSSVSHVDLRQILFGGDGHDAKSLPGRFRHRAFCFDWHPRSMVKVVWRCFLKGGYLQIINFNGIFH